VGLPRDRDALAAAVEGEAVIAALDSGRHDFAVRQRRGAMATAVDQRGGPPLAVAEQDDRLVADAARQRLLSDLVGPGGDVPGIADQHVSSRRWRIDARYLRPWLRLYAWGT